MEYGLYKTEAARMVDEHTIEVTLVNPHGRHGECVRINLIVRAEHPKWSMDTTVEIQSHSVVMKP